MSSFIMDDIIEVTVGAILVGYVGIIGIKAITNASGLNASSTLGVIFYTVLPIFVTIAFLYIIIGCVRRSRSY